MTEATRDFYDAVTRDDRHTFVPAGSAAANAVIAALLTGADGPLRIATGAASPVLPTSDITVSSTTEELEQLAVVLLSSPGGVLFVDTPYPLMQTARFAETAAQVAMHPEVHDVTVVYRA